MKLKITAVSLLVVCMFLSVKGQKNYPPEIDCSNMVTYKELDKVKLKLWIFNPPKHSIKDKTPAIVFFFGGGWNGGSPEQFVKQCEYLSARGMVAMVADYRVKSRNNVTANKCVNDAKSAVRWIRQHASELGVDPERIVAGGGSAGGHLAASTALLPEHDEPDEDLSISSKPNALVLFNPVVVLAPVENMEYNVKKMEGMEKRLGAKPETMSPYHNINKTIPPTIIFHGTADTTVPYKSVVLFTSKMKELDNLCTLVGYKNEPHGFFNYSKKMNAPFIDTVNKMDKFLVSLGYLQAPPKVTVVK